MFLMDLKCGNRTKIKDHYILDLYSECTFKKVEKVWNFRSRLFPKFRIFNKNQFYLFLGKATEC